MAHPGDRDRRAEAARPRWRRWAWLLPLLIAAAAYAPAPGGDMVWDDKIVVDQQLPAIVTWRDALWPPAGIEQWSGSYYRPLVVLSYMADRALFGGGAAGPHLANVVFHALATLALLALLVRLLDGRAGGYAGALAGACLFAAHPIHVESVSWMSGRSDVLATLFLLPAVSLALRWRDTGSGPALAGAAAATFCALLAKEVAAAALVIVPAALLLAPPPAGAPGRGPRTSALTWGGIALALLAATLACLALRWSAGVTAAGPGAPAAPGDAALPAQALAFLALKSLWPWPQSHFVPARALPGAAATALVLAALAALCAWGIARWRRRGDGLPLLALAWFAAATAPVIAATLLKVAEAPVAERYLYLPSVAVALLFALPVAALLASGRRAAAAALTVPLILALGAATYRRALVWQDDESLWSDAVAKAPDEALPLNELAVVRETRGDLDGALGLWERARALHPEPQIAGTVEGNIGLVHLQRGDHARARSHLEAALRLNPDQYNARRGLGAALYTEAATIPITPATAPQVRALLESARTHYAAALRLNPATIPARLELALVLARLGDLTARFGGGASPTDYYAEALGHMEWVFARRPAAANVPATRMLAENLRSALAGARR